MFIRHQLKGFGHNIIPGPVKILLAHFVLVFLKELEQMTKQFIAY
jgi:hypothetical protein